MDKMDYQKEIDLYIIVLSILFLLTRTKYMPAHLKSVILGGELTIPIANGRLKMGVWQGIYLCEHRNSAGSRTIIATINGESYE